MTALTPRPGILNIDAYVPGESESAAGTPPVKLSSNETPFGPSPAALAAYRACSSLHRYPDGSALALRTAIAAACGLDPARIVCGAGSDELLSLLAYGYLQPGDEAIYTEHGFLVYRIAILASGGVPIVAPEQDFRTDVDAILREVSPHTRMVFIANPNNPTGTYLRAQEVQLLRDELPQNVLLVLDAAYAEYVGRHDYEAGAAFVEANENVVMTRTFSKIHGLAALRLGWAYCPPAITDVLNRIRGPFNVSAPSIAAGIASMKDTATLATAAKHNEHWRAWLSDKLSELGLVVTPSVTNFVLMHFPVDGPQTAAAADAFLKAQSILLRRVDAYGLPNALRMSIGTEDENRMVVGALARFLGRSDAEAKHIALSGLPTT